MGYGNPRPFTLGGRFKSWPHGGGAAPRFNLDFSSASFDYTRASFSRYGARERIRSDGISEQIACGPRFDYHPTTHALRGLLIEPSVQNIHGDSNFYFPSAGVGVWTNSNINNASSGAVLGPDGVPGIKITDAITGAGTFFFRSTDYISVTNGATYTAFVDVKAAEYTFLRAEIFDSSGYKPVYFNLSNGTVGTQTSGATGSITDLGGGIYRCAVTRTVAATTVNWQFNGAPADGGSGKDWTYTGTSGSGVYVFRAMMVAGSSVPSFIKTGSFSTTGFPLTAGADALTFTIPTGGSSITYTFDDDTTQTVSVSPGSYTVPTNLNRKWIKSIRGNWVPQSISLPSAYTGQIATKTRISESLTGTYKQANYRTSHLAMDDITSLQVGWAPWITSGATSVDSAGTMAATIKAAIEYPVGTVVGELKFSGSSSGTLNGTTLLLSDAFSVTIPKGAEFFVRCFYDSPNHVVYTAWSTGLIAGYTNDIAEVAASGLTDRHLSGTLTQTGTQNPMYPAVILGSTRVPSVAIIGDSRACGVYLSRAWDNGEIKSWLGERFPYLDLAMGGEQLTNWNAQATYRKGLIQYCSHVLIQMGVNDLANSRTDAQLRTDVNTCIAANSGKTILLSTISPVSTSTDSWATTANQTTAAYNADRVSHNNWRRGVPSGVTACFDVADIVESARDSGKWRTPVGTVNTRAVTVDGVHEHYVGQWYVRENAAFDFSLITR